MALLALVLLETTAPPAEPCAGKATAVLVQTQLRRLFLCEDGRSIDSMAVALGSGGVGKRREGDAKVPLGTYALERPVPSRQFHTFILVGYPTPAQRRAGLTGSAIGVHGPARGYEGPASTTVDWTLGCIAVGTDREIDSVAGWVRSRRVGRIVIE